MSRLLLLIAALLGAALLHAQETDPVQRVEVRVTAVNGASFYVDRGSDAGMQPGDVVRLFPVGQPEAAGVVRSVTKKSARCELAPGAGAIDIGVRGEVLVPPGRALAGGPEHPPWQYPTEEWSADMPLLAPPRALTEAERESTFGGRWYTTFDATEDREQDRERLYTLARTGVDLTWTNPFHRGGGLNVDAEVYRRIADLDGEPDDEETRFRLDRLSYWQGGTRESPLRFEAGRFLQNAFPEFGVLDGLEVARRLDSGSRFGGSVGTMPTFPEMDTSDDLQLAAFYEHVAGPRDELLLALGAHKSWHDGEADRDLVVGRAEWAPSERLSLFGAAWVDWYGSNDVIKDGLELTELHVSGNYRFESGAGLGAGLSDIKWPELLRTEFAPLPPAELEDSEVTRLWLSGFTPVSEHVDLNARIDHWSDEEDDGLGGALGVDWQDLIFEDGRVGIEAFTQDGSFSSVIGVRFMLDGPLGSGRWNAGYELAENEQEDFSGDQEQLLQHDVRLGYDLYLASGWSVSVFGDQRFGDEQNSTALGIFLQKSF